ncbi:MAG TPA: hypothetical protein VGB83_12780 [Actinomycetota bacterium]
MATTDLSPPDAARARALATPTRVEILEHLRTHGPCDVRRAAQVAGVHSNVARGHLDVLVAAGLATASYRRNANGGRPAKIYQAAPTHVEDGPQLVSDVLATLIEAAAPAPGTARKIALEAGERLGRKHGVQADGLAFEDQVKALVESLGEVSGGIRVVESGENWVEIEDLDCPFKGIAPKHPELACSLDKALKEGVMRALGAEVFVEVVTSIAWGDPTCREVVRWR